METFKVPKEQARVSLCVPPHPPEERVLFLSAFAEAHQGSETVSDLLLRPQRFLPMLNGGGAVSLVRKEAIRWLRVEEPGRAEWHYLEEREGTPRAKVRIEFSAGGDAVEGVVHALTPPGEQRTLDVVNLLEGFLHVETAEGLYLVNLAHVCHVHILEETDAGA